MDTDNFEVEIASYAIEESNDCQFKDRPDYRR